MACTKCKKKTTIENISETNLSVLPVSTFKLRGVIGAIQMSFGSGQFVSNSNLTDELALDFLRVNPNRISMFEVYPENWKDLISDTKNNDEQMSKG